MFKPTSRCRSALRTRAFLTAFAGLCAAASTQTLTQTLPVGFDLVDGDANSDQPVNVGSATTSQWHYDASNFAATQEILITEIYVRASSPTADVSEFDLQDFELTLIEATTDYRVGSHSPTFANNALRSEVVKRSAWRGGEVRASGGFTGDWISLELDAHFAYDPTSGNDLIVQIRSCDPTKRWGTELDCASGAPGTVGGNRYGHSSSCTAPVQSFADDEMVPIVRIDYRPVASQTLPLGFDDANGLTGTGLPNNTSSSQRWQWHYDSGQIAPSGPIAITEVSVRAVNATQTVDAFEFPSFTVQLAEAATDYRTTSHSTLFADNVRRSTTVKNNGWRGSPVGPSGEAASTWIPFQLQDAFVYDRTTGNDFIVEIQSCNPGTPWGVSMDGIAGAAGTNGGNRYGHTSDCFATAESFRNNEFVPIVRVHWVSAIVSSYPYVETFDDSAHLTNGSTRTPWIWQQSSTDGTQDWFVRNQPTPSTNTGPPADHTTAIPGVGFYAHTEDSNGELAAISLDSPYFDLSALSSPLMSFWVHSRDADGGIHQNFLHLDVISYPSGFLSADVIAPIGDQGDGWRQHSVDLSGFVGQTVQVRFRGRTDGGSFSHDIAIDDIRVADFVAGTGQAPRSTALLDVNDATDPNGLVPSVGLPGPFFANAEIGGDIRLTVRGEASRFYQVGLGPLNVGFLPLPIGTLDLGPSLSIISIPGLSTTDALGRARLSFSVPRIPLGTTFGFQAVVASAQGLRLSNAVEVTVVR